MLAVTLIFTLFLGLSLVSASDIDIDDTVSLSDNNNVQTSSSNIAIDDIEDNDDDESKYSNPTVAGNNAGNGDIVKDISNSMTISELNETINSGNSSIILNDDYTYNQGTDSRFIDLGGIVISRDLTIDGQGHTVDLGGKIRFLNVTGHSITLKNINIINGYAYNGGAIYIESGTGSIINSTFNNNNAEEDGGAIYIFSSNGSVINSTFTNNEASSDGGAIFIFWANCSIINSTFNNNNAIWGGAIHIYESTGSVINSTFTNNNAEEDGGAIYIDDGNVNIINSTFTNNNAKYGGAIYINYGDVSVMNSTFTNNTAYLYGGAIYIYESTGSITNSTFTNNNVNFDGGAIHIERSTGNFSITNSTFTNNNAGEYGRAIHITNNGNCNIINSIFTNNTVEYAGSGASGAIYIDDGNVNIINSTFTNNNAGEYGGAIYISKGNGTITNSTFTNNTATNSGGAIYYTSGILNVTKSRFKDNFGNIVYTDNNDNISVDSATRSLSDPDLICNETAIKVQLNNYTYESEGSIFCNVSCGKEIVYGVAYVVIGNITYTGFIMNGNGTIALPDNISVGNYTLDIIYNGTGADSWAKSRISANLIVYKKDVDMNVSASNITYTEDGLVNVSFNQAVEGLAYIIYDNMTYSVNISGDSGVITVPGLMPGVYIFDVYFNSSNYNASMKTVSFTVFKKDPLMDVSVANITYGEDAVIFVNFAEKLNCTVYVIYNNVNYTGNITDGKGNITIKGLNAGNYSLNVIFDETILYNTTSAPAVFTIFKANSTISVTADDVDYGNAIYVNVTTSCEDGDIFLVINDKTYTGYIRNGVGIINVDGLEPGYYSTNVTYNGSVNYNPCVVPVNFTVNRLNPSLIISSIDINGRDVTISIFTTGEDSVAYVIINNQTYTGDVVNHQGVINITGLEPGYYEANVTYNGTKYYNPCNAPVNFTFGKNASSITVTADDVDYPSNVIISVSTNCDNGIIFVEVNGQTYYGYIVGGNGNIIVPGLEPGFYELNVTYNGSDRYNPCVAPVNFTVLKQNATVTTKVDIVGDDVLITVFTNGEDSVAYVTINNVTYSTNIVNLTGVINITGLKPDNYEANVTYNGSSHYAPCVVPVNFTINKIPTSISASDATYVLNYANVYKVTFNPKLAGFNITFTLNGKIVGSAITDASGVASITLTAAQLKTAGAGKHNMLVSFAGDDTYLSSNVTKTITINKEATKFINVKSVKKSYKSTDKSMQLTATLKNNKNNVIKNQVVYFKVNNKKTYKVKTNSKGVATLTLNSAKIKACKLNKKGNYKFTVTYKTTATYKQASKNGTLKVL